MAESVLLEESINLLNIDLKQEQRLALKSLLLGKDVLAILTTGFGKSRIYQTYTAVKDAHTGTALVLVIAPLTSIIKDQIAHLNRLNIPSAELSDKMKS